MKILAVGNTFITPIYGLEEQSPSSLLHFTFEKIESPGGKMPCPSLHGKQTADLALSSKSHDSQVSSG